jgi:hypothetical protein
MISLVFLLNDRFMPVVKWIHRAVADLPLLGAVVHDQIIEILTVAEPRQQVHVMSTLVNQAIQALRDQGLSDSPINFLLDHAPVVHGKIKDARLKKRLNVVQQAIWKQGRKKRTGVKLETYCKI